ncbi:hypothetical protein VQL36_04920 [Chengkuizengella sp. SCS-71B]|uniref:hypothetical protein n=1 Tax=Chengkuizengella sp. SCS-71B TaxID=3115290 RepID=UPI0032C22C6D
MRIIYRSIFPVVILSIGIMMLLKGAQLWSLGDNVDGDGIGITFLLFEINDTVHTADIPKYTNGFFVAGLITIVISFGFLYKAVRNLRH